MKTVYYVNRVTHKNGVTTAKGLVTDHPGDDEYVVCKRTYNPKEKNGYNFARQEVIREAEAMISECRPI